MHLLYRIYDCQYSGRLWAVTAIYQEHAWTVLGFDRAEASADAARRVFLLAKHA